MTGPQQRRTRSLLAIGGWGLAAAAATAVGLLATGTIGTAITGTTATPLSEQQVARALTRATPAASTQPAPTARATPAGGVTRVLDTPGGTVIARCRAGQAILLSWSPAQGYDSEHLRPGPARAASLTFDGPDTATRVRVTCPAGIPTAHTTTGPDADQDQD